MKHYLYRHIRNDNDNVFYIGVGTKKDNSDFNCEKNEFLRAYSKRSRNKFWKNIINKTDYDIEIMLESNNYDFILEKEKEFIELYGRRDENSGTLCNLTEGGNGIVGNIVSEETRSKMSKWQIGKSLSKECKDKISKTHLNRKNYLSKRILQIDIDTKEVIEEFDSISEASRSLNLKSPSSITNFLKGRSNSAGGYEWKLI